MRVKVEDRVMSLSNLDKVLYPESGVDKAAVLRHYQAVAPVMLPHLRNRPLSLRRFPDGITGQGFFQKNVFEHFPDWVSTVSAPHRRRSGAVEMVTCDNLATLVYLANLACLEFHTWIARADQLMYPDRLVIDVDPPPNSPLSDVRETVRGLRGLFQAIGLEPFLLATGGKGYHVVAPLDRAADYDVVRTLSHEIAAFAARLVPSRLTADLNIERRKGRIFLDAYRNGYSQTAITAYSLRARPGATVATPIEWDELDTVDPDAFRIDDLPERLADRECPWSDFDEHAVSAGDVTERLAELTAD